jgi:oxidoreductase
VFIALGTTAKAAGSPEAFERIDREYVINAARSAKSEGHPQRLVYVSVSPAVYFFAAYSALTWV